MRLRWVDVYARPHRETALPFSLYARRTKASQPRRARSLWHGAFASRARLWRFALAGVLLGAALGMAIGFDGIAHTTKDRVRQTAEQLITLTHAREAEVDSVIAALDHMHSPPCSPTDLMQLRSLVVGAAVVQDVFRRDHGKTMCSAVYGSAAPAIPALAEAGFSFSPDAMIWRFAKIPSINNKTYTLVGHGDAIIVVLPAASPPDFAPGYFRVSRFFINLTTHHMNWFAGRPVQAPVSLLQDGRSFWLNGSFIAVDCAADRMMCLVVQAPWQAILRNNITQFVLCGVAGSLGGGATGFMLLIWQQQRRSFLQSLRRALQEEKLSLHYQPIYHAVTGRITGAEALLRWPDKGGIMIEPDRFIPAAERTGMISALTIFVIRRASQDLGAFLRAHPNFTVSINIVADNLEDEKFHAALARYITGTGISPSQIALELTERRAAEVEAANESLNRLRSQGYKIYIDDFGTGFSSLSYLSDLSIDAIKLDKSFTSTVNTDAVRARLVPPMLEMAKEIGVPVIVEGVETEFQAAYFRQNGAYALQGWLFGQPTAAPALMALVGWDARICPTPAHAT